MIRTAQSILASLIVACIALVVMLIITATEAQASCIGNWPGSQSDSSAQTQQLQHKALHLLGSAAVTAGVAWATDDIRLGVAAGIGLGLAREVYKAKTPGMRCEWSSMAYDAIGIGIGAYGANRWLITPRHNGIQLSWSRRF